MASIGANRVFLLFSRTSRAIVVEGVIVEAAEEKEEAVAVIIVVVAVTITVATVEAAVRGRRLRVKW